MQSVHVHLRTVSALNVREHWSTRAARVRNERDLTGWMLKRMTKPEPPLIVTLTRVAPSNGLDDDNLSGALKGVRDAVADWLGVDDKDRETVRYEYAQRRGPWGVEIEWRSA